MASITSLKAVRTRYRNTLDKELHAASDLLKRDTTDTDSISMLNNSMDILRTYIDKLEIQSGKLSDAVSESDTTFFEEVVNEDCALIEEAERCIICIKKWGSAKASVKQENVTSNTSNSDVLDLQHQMQELMASQLKHQQEMLERQERRERERHQEHSVKLPKFELVSFNGNKLHWTEF